MVILRCAGKDATEDFDSVHPRDLLTEALPKSAICGYIDPAELAMVEAPPTLNEDRPSSSPKPQGPPPLSTLINLNDFEEVAKQYLPANAWAYYSSGADDEISKRNNRRAYQKVALRPRILKKVSSVDTTTSILGQTVSMPVYMSAVGIAKLAHPDGECALARVAGKEGLAQLLANSSSMSVEQVRVARTSEDQPLFFQLYVNKDIQKSVEMVKRGVQAGAQAIWITVDSPVVGKRESDERLNLAVTVSLTPVPLLN
jgi:isopentenyl diphosphate isomerase/L-lactate dehydrogenase-like FMN-dependent dehydrogenase